MWDRGTWSALETGVQRLPTSGLRATPHVSALGLGGLPLFRRGVRGLALKEVEVHVFDLGGRDALRRRYLTEEERRAAIAYEADPF